MIKIYLFLAPYHNNISQFEHIINLTITRCIITINISIYQFISTSTFRNNYFCNINYKNRISAIKRLYFNFFEYCTLLYSLFWYDPNKISATSIQPFLQSYPARKIPFYVFVMVRRKQYFCFYILVKIRQPVINLNISPK